MNGHRYKFRAWDIKKKRWHTDWRRLFPWGTRAGEEEIVHVGIMPNHFIFCQYTGLKDNNGVPIYEGNIAKDDSGEIYFVRYYLNRWVLAQSV